ncbi:hypothetical protein BDN72DRAFT_899803 [Pluteus cervinus]|uniref:Uncharacterized protein n=1 Tax=Pluteus cervinus TaxID=181527 RepID=A0ACD3ANH1_9AGAR|nr:hypothetical protein BDN72DRAFT_899803 [Pluteus cervinus]
MALESASFGQSKLIFRRIQPQIREKRTLISSFLALKSAKSRTTNGGSFPGPAWCKGCLAARIEELRKADVRDALTGIGAARSEEELLEAAMTENSPVKPRTGKPKQHLLPHLKVCTHTDWDGLNHYWNGAIKNLQFEMDEHEMAVNLAEE